MKIVEQFEEYLPSWAPYYIEYGDAEGLLPEEVESVDRYMKSLEEEYPGCSILFDYDEEPEFRTGSALSRVAGDCYRTVVTILEDEYETA